MSNMPSEQAHIERQIKAKMLSSLAQTKSTSTFGEQNTNKNRKNQQVYANHRGSVCKMQQQIFQCQSRNNDKSHRAVQQMLKKKLIVSEYTGTKGSGQKFVNKLISKKKSPRKNNCKEKLASLNALSTQRSGQQMNRAIESSSQLQKSSSDFYSANGHKLQDVFNSSNKMKRSQQKIARINNNIGIIRSGSVVVLHKKQTTNHSKRMRFIVRSYEKPYQSTTKNVGQNNSIPKYPYIKMGGTNYGIQIVQEQQTQRWLKKKTADQSKNPIWRQKTSSLNSEDEFNHKQVGNFKSAFDQFRIKKKRINFPNEIDHRLKSSLSNKLNRFAQNNSSPKEKNQQINGWIEDNSIQQETNGVYHQFSSLRVEEAQIDEEQFIQFIQRSKQYQIQMSDSYN